MSVIVTTSPGKPGFVSCIIRGREVSLPRSEATQLCIYLAHALLTSDVPAVRGIKAYQLEQRRKA